MATKCVNCLLPSAVPDAQINGDGICRSCRQQDGTRSQVGQMSREDLQADLEAALRDCRGKGEFDCLVNLSGGKDSCFLLYKLKREYKLDVLAFTTNINIPAVAWKNIHRTIQLLDVPHVVYTPPREFYRKLYRFLLQNQESRGAVRTVCYVCAPLFEGYALKAAVEKGIPLIVAGYSPGQPDADRMVYEFPQQTIRNIDWTPREVRASQLFSHAELQLFWNPLLYPTDAKFPRYLAPFHAWPYDQSEVMKRVVDLGLIANRRHASPVFSNCPVNWLLMYSDLKTLGFNPYAPEFSALIREGKASRRHWKVVGPIVDFMIRHRILLGRNVTKSLRWLDLRPSDLRVTRLSETQMVDYGDTDAP